MPNDTLVVPVKVAAFAVNPQTRDGDGSYVMLRWTANFRSLVADNAAPEPAPFVITEPWTQNPESRLGVYLQWELPEALCRGHQDEETGEIGDFPLVPNRWLVVRRSGRGTRSWIVHSDYLGTGADGVSYLDPHAATATATVIGRRVDLTPGSPWNEPGGTPFLTAVGPGLLTFSAFQPYNKNVFSIHDTLEDIEGEDRLSYWVAGGTPIRPATSWRSALRASRSPTCLTGWNGAWHPVTAARAGPYSPAAPSASAGSRTDRPTRPPARRAAGTSPWRSATAPPRRPPSCRRQPAARAP